MKKLLIIVTAIIVIAVSISYSNYPFKFIDRGQQEDEPKGDIDDNSIDIKAKKPANLEDTKQDSKFVEDLEILEQEAQKAIDVNLYFFDREKGEFIAEQRRIDLTLNELEAFHVVNSLIKGPKSQSLEGIISSETKIINIEKNENLITVDLSPEFLDSEDLLLARVSLVNSLTDLEDVKYVRIYIDGTELTSDGKKDGIALGLLAKYPNTLDEIIAIDSRVVQKSDVREVASELYFVDSQGAYLLPEVRNITVISNQYARAIIEELIKGPSSQDKGLYPIFPKGIRLLDIKLIEEDDSEDDGLELYFSKEFKELGAGSARELTTLGSLVHSLTRLPNVGWIKIYYQDDKGEYIDSPIGNISLTERLVKEDFTDLLGKRIKIYFSDKDIKRLKPQYRAINKKELGIAKKILYELTQGPMGEPDCEDVIPDEVPIDRIKVSMNGRTAIVDLPSEFYEIQSKNNQGIISLYAIANSLTDPTNTENIDKVLFLMDGKQVDRYADMVIADPFVRNPALIEE